MCAGSLFCPQYTTHPYIAIYHFGLPHKLLHLLVLPSDFGGMFHVPQGDVESHVHNFEPRIAKFPETGEGIIRGRKAKPQ